MNIGDRLRCRKCGHEREVTFEWLKNICAGKPGGGEKFREELSKHLDRFKCAICGSRGVQRVAVDMPIPRQRMVRDPTRVDEGIAGSREDNKRMKSQMWGQIVNREK